MALSGTVTLVAANTNYPGPDEMGSEFTIEAHPSNTGIVTVGDAGSAATGYALQKGQQIVLRLANLKEVVFWAATANDKVCWIKNS